MLPLAGVFVAAAVVRWFGLTRDASPWRHRVDWPLTVLAGVLGTGWLTRGNGPYWFMSFPLTTSDFGQYCAAVSQGFVPPMSVSVQRSMIAGAIPAVLARHTGLLIALSGGALLGTMVFCGSLYAAARLLHSRLAGAFTLGAIGLFVPLIAMPRLLSFYPESTAVVALGTCAAISAVVCRTRQSCLFAGLGAGFVAIIDVRGWLLMLPLCAVALVGCLAPSPHARWSRFVLFVVPLLVAWHVGGLPGVMPTGSLAEQFCWFVADSLSKRGVSMPVVAPTEHESFSFGGSPLSDIRPTLAYLARTRELGHGTTLAPEARLATACISGLLRWLAPCAMVAAVALRRKPIAAAALAVLAAPGVLSALETLQLFPYARQFLVAMLAGPVVIGVAAGGLFVDSGAPWRPGAGRTPGTRAARASGAAQVILALCFAALVQFGRGGKPLTAQLVWPGLVDSEPRTTWAALDGGTPDRTSMFCFSRLALERREGGAIWPPWIELPGSQVDNGPVQPGLGPQGPPLR